MKFNKQLIEQLRAGEIAVKNHPKNPETLKEILKEASPEDVPMVKGDCDLYALHKSTGYPCWSVLSWHTKGLPIIPIADFLLPEFKIGDKVKIINEDPIYTITKCRYEGEEVGEMHINRDFRKRKYSAARQMLCYLSYMHSVMKLVEIGAKIGRDHTTVLYAIRTPEGQMEVGEDDVISNYQSCLAFIKKHRLKTN